jgi:hypothetical protein
MAPTLRALAVVALVAHATSAAAQDEKKYGPFQVDRSGWVATGIRLDPGGSIRVESTGTVGECGPDGCGNWNWFAVTVKVGDKIKPVGSSGTFWIEPSEPGGDAYLGLPRTREIYPDDAKNAPGSFTVWVYVKGPHKPPSGEPPAGGAEDCDAVADSLESLLSQLKDARNARARASAELATAKNVEATMLEKIRALTSGTGDFEPGIVRQLVSEVETRRAEAPGEMLAALTAIDAAERAETDLARRLATERDRAQGLHCPRRLWWEEQKKREEAMKPPLPPSIAPSPNPRQNFRVLGQIGASEIRQGADSAYLESGMLLRCGGVIAVHSEFGLLLRLPNGSTALVADGSVVTVKEGGGLDIQQGSAQDGRAYLSDWHAQYESLSPVTTPAATVTPEGTVYAVSHGPTGTRVTVFEGRVRITPRRGGAGAEVRAGEALLVQSGAGPSGGAHTWRGFGVTDCAGGDVGESLSSGRPDPARCNERTAGTIAICWDGTTYANRFRAGAWCTYKSTASRACAGGSNPGVAYACEGPGARESIDDVTLPAGGEEPATGVSWGTRADGLGTQPGQRFKIKCPENGTLSPSLWGSDLYTADSLVCTAAVHAGLIDTARGGAVTLELRSGASSYLGSSRHGATSKDFGAWSLSFVFVGATTTSTFPQDEYTVVTWTTAARELGTREGQQFTVFCPESGMLSTNLWGTDLYTNDSSVCTAAVHAGRITTAGGGRVTIELRPGSSGYRGSTRHGATSKDYPQAWPGSFVFR